MPPVTDKLAAAVETYFADLRRIRASGGATPELSFRAPLENLLNAVGGALKPKVFCVGEMVDQGAGRPDFGLYAAKQYRKGQNAKDQKPECGVVEVKPFGDDAWRTAESGQVSRYRARYGLRFPTLPHSLGKPRPLSRRAPRIGIRQRAALGRRATQGQTAQGWRAPSPLAQER